MRGCVFFLTGILLLAGCGRPADPLDTVVHAANEVDYGTWQTDHWSDLSYRNRSQYEKAINETRFFLMRETSGRSSLEQRQQLLAQINGQKVRTIIVQGMLFANDRLEPMLEHDRGALKRNQFLLDETPNTVDQRRNLLRVVDEIKGRIEAVQGEMSLNEAVIHEVDPSGAISRAAPRPQTAQ